jgi:thymidylate synthase
MKEYLKNLEYILEFGEEKSDRTNTGTLSVFGMQSRYNLQEGFPAVTTKQLAWKAVTSELLWFIEGSNDERRLCEILHGTREPERNTIWTGNANADYWKPKAQFPGDLGNVYGVQWRSWGGRIGPKIDQLANLIEGIKKDPHGRRHILTAWQPAELDSMALPPCHILSQFYVSNKGELSCQMYQRSADFFLGVPFNIASYSLLTHMIAQVCGLHVKEFIHSIGDAHIYKNHIPQVKEQLSRQRFDLPTLKINPNVSDIDHFIMTDFELENYRCLGPLTAPMAV